MTGIGKSELKKGEEIARLCFPRPAEKSRDGKRVPLGDVESAKGCEPPVVDW